MSTGVARIWNGTQWVLVTGPRGPQGPQGPVGPAVNIKGSVADESELPMPGSEGEPYLIDGDLWVWVGDRWENVGNIQGPTGEGVPPGGDTGQALVKRSNANHDTEWGAVISGAEASVGNLPPFPPTGVGHLWVDTST